MFIFRLRLPLLVLTLLLGWAPIGWAQFDPESESFWVTPLNQIVVTFTAGVNHQQFAQQHGLTLNYTFGTDVNTSVFGTGTVQRATSLTQTLSGQAGVRSVFQDRQVRRTQMWVPSDPYFNNRPSPENFGGQWHLNNNVGGVATANITAAWAGRVAPGTGVNLGVVDSGVQASHEDIAPNYNAANSFDCINNSATITLTSSDLHGHAVAGVAAARGGNNLGGTGAAPFGTIGTIRVFNGGTAGSDAQFIQGINFKNGLTATDIHVKNHSYGIGAGYISESAAFLNALANSANAGTINVVSAGNERVGQSGGGAVASGEDSNRKDMQNQASVITVAALGSNSVFADYSCFGANIFVTAPSSSSAGLGITTVDRDAPGDIGYNTAGGGDYSVTGAGLNPLGMTAGFGGTSSAAPLVAGVIMLGKEINPNMNTRLAKHILARTAAIINAGDVSAQSDGGWRTNAAGFEFNQNYGFGNIDASAFVAMADDFSGVTPLVTATTGTITVSAGGSNVIPEDTTAAGGITRSSTNNTAGLMEELIVNLNITHSDRETIEAYVTSPSGYTSRLTRRYTGTTVSNINWDFLTNAFWGEQAQGTWTVRVVDIDTAGANGTWNSYSITWNMGTVVAVPEPFTVGLFATAIGGMGYWSYRRRQTRVMIEDEDAVEADTDVIDGETA